MRYQLPKRVSKEEVERALSSGTPQAAAEALIAMGLFEPDLSWAQMTALCALDHPEQNVKAAALTSLGHLARIHRSIDLSLVLPALKRFEGAPLLGGIAQDVLDDISMYVKGAKT